MARRANQHQKSDQHGGGDAAPPQSSLQPVIAVKYGDRDDGTPNDGHEERPRDQKAPGEKSGNHSYANRSFYRALHERVVAIGQFRICHGRPL